MTKTLEKKTKPTIDENNPILAIATGKLKIGGRGIERFSPDITYEECEATARFYGNLRDFSKWVIGDLLNFAENKFGEKYAQMMESTKLEYNTLKNYCWVSKAYEWVDRREISFTHHQEVAGIEREYRDELLQTAIDEGLTVKELRTLANPPGEKDKPINVKEHKRALKDENREISDPVENEKAQLGVTAAMIYIQSSDTSKWPEIQKDQWARLKEKFNMSIPFELPTTQE